MLRISIYVMFSVLSISKAAANEYTQICTNPQPQICRGTTDLHKDVVTTLNKKLNTAKSNLLKRAGYKNWRQLIEAQLNKSGFAVNSYSMTLLKSLTNSGQDDVPLARVYMPLAQCQSKVDSLIRLADSTEDELEQLELAKQMWSEVQAYRKEMQKWFERDANASAQLVSEFSYACSEGYSPEDFGYEADDVPQLTWICDQIERSKVSISLAVKSGQMNFQFLNLIRKILQLNTRQTLRSNFGEELEDSLNGTGSSQHLYYVTQPTSGEDACSGTSDESNALRRVLSAKIRSEVLKLYRSEDFVNELLNQFYPQDLGVKVDADFRNIKQKFNQVIARWPLGTAQGNRMAKIAADVKLSWPRANPKMFELDPGSGLRVLRESSTSANLTMVSMFFSDLGLSNFTMPNAFFVNKGMMSNKSTVVILPYFVELYRRNPNYMIPVLSHELGHQFDFNIQALQLLNLDKVYGNLISCLSKPDSIGMTRNQYGESIADFIASEIIAESLSSSVAANRKMVADSMMADCLFHELSGTMGADHGDYPHPYSYLRMAGIFLANPLLRAKIGCTKPQPRFRTCHL